MNVRIPVAVAMLAALVSGSVQEAKAQPAVPARAPGYTPFMGVLGRGAVGVGGYYGLYRPNIQLQQLQAELNQANANLSQTQAVISNMVNASLPQTGRGGVFNSLGHWYPSSKYGGGGGAMGGYGIVNTARMPVMPAGGVTGGAVVGGFRR